VGDKTPLLGLTLDDALAGKKKGAEVEASQAVPAEFSDARLAGKTLTIRALVQEIKSKVLPDLDDEFAKDLGDYKTLADLRARVRSQLELDLKRDVEDHYKDLCMKRLVETNHFEVPDSLLQREVEAMVQEAQQRQRRFSAAALGVSGGPDQALDLRKLREESLPMATFRVRLGLVLEALGKQEGITVTETDIEQECRQMARAMKMDASEVKKLLLSGGKDALEDLRSRILAEKSLQFVYEKAIIQM
jgi:trigger factor